MRGLDELLVSGPVGRIGRATGRAPSSSPTTRCGSRGSCSRTRTSYAIVPHAGGWRGREAGVLAEAIRFNAPLCWTEGAGGSGSFASVDGPGLVLDTVKRAEDSDALVLRLYEAHGGRGTARLRLGIPFASARLASGLEEDRTPLEVEGDAIVLSYRPHAVLTVKVT